MSTIDYYDNGMIKRIIIITEMIDQQYILYFHNNGLLHQFCIQNNNGLHNDFGPAKIIYNDAGIPISSAWYVNGQIQKIINHDNSDTNLGIVIFNTIKDVKSDIQFNHFVMYKNVKLGFSIIMMILIVILFALIIHVI